MFTAGDPLYPEPNVRKKQEERRPMTTVMDLSNARVGAVERVSGWMFAVHGRPRLPSTGLQWRTGLVVTANHTVEHDAEVTLTRHGGRPPAASVAGRALSLDVTALHAG